MNICVYLVAVFLSSFVFYSLASKGTGVVGLAGGDVSLTSGLNHFVLKPISCLVEVWRLISITTRLSRVGNVVLIFVFFVLSREI